MPLFKKLPTIYCTGVLGLSFLFSLGAQTVDKPSTPALSQSSVPNEEVVGGALPVADGPGDLRLPDPDPEPDTASLLPEAALCVMVALAGAMTIRFFAKRSLRP